MSDEALFTPSNPWLRRAVGLTIAVVVVTFEGAAVVSAGAVSASVVNVSSSP